MTGVFRATAIRVSALPVDDETHVPIKTEEILAALSEGHCPKCRERLSVLDDTQTIVLTAVFAPVQPGCPPTYCLSCSCVWRVQRLPSGKRLWSWETTS